MARDCPDRQRGSEARNQLPGVGGPARRIGAGDAVDREMEVRTHSSFYEAELTLHRTSCRNFPEIRRTALRDRSKLLLLATHGIRVDTVAESLLVRGSPVLPRHRVALLHGHEIVRTTTAVVVVPPLHLGLNIKTVLATEAMAVLLVLLLAPRAAVLLHGRLKLPRRLLLVATDMVATLDTISPVTGVHLLLLPQVSVTSFSNTASRHRLRRRLTSPRHLPARLPRHPLAMCHHLHHRPRRLVAHMVCLKAPWWYLSEGTSARSSVRFGDSKNEGLGMRGDCLRVCSLRLRVVSNLV